MKAKAIKRFYDRVNSCYRDEKDDAFEVEEGRLKVLISAGVAEEAKEEKTEETEKPETPTKSAKKG